MERSRSYSGNVPSNGSVKIGGLWKRSQGLSRFTRPNYRHRVFILTENALSYYSGTVDRVGQLKGRVALDAITAVEFVDESAFNLPHTFQVVYTTKKSGFVILHVTSTDSAECSDWVTTLRQACYFNKEMMMHYHPGALLRNCWSCCKQTGKTSLGCQPTYHLLTRSSSRYAQMRRKDTLTSSQGSQGRRSKSSSVPREERMSRTPVPGARTEEEGGGRDSGRGLSNSCFDLTRRQIQNSFEPVSASMEGGSRCSSQLSTEPSISVGCITLTRLSLSESATPLSPPLPTPPAGKREVTGRSPVVGAEGKGGGVKRNRVQIAPEYTPTIRSRQTFPSSESQPHLAHRTTVPVLPDRFSHSTSLHFPTSSGHTPSQTTPTGQTRPVLAAASPVAYHCLTEPRRSRQKTHPRPPPPSQLSTSMSHLLPQKPVLEPKVSVTDPNTIHV